MEWINLIITMLPIILELFEKAERSQEGVAEMRLMGTKLMQSASPEIWAFGQILVCCSKNPELRKAQREQFAASLAKSKAEYKAFLQSQATAA